MSMMINPYRFTPPANDPHFANVVLLCGFEGSDGSASFIDESAAGHTLFGQDAAQIDTAQFKFGASSLLLDGIGDHITVADSNDWDFGSGEFTIEAFVRLSAVDPDWFIVSQG